METWWPMCGSPAVGNPSSPALSSGGDEALVTGQVETITSSTRGVGSTTATVKPGVDLAAPGRDQRLLADIWLGPATRRRHLN